MDRFDQRGTSRFQIVVGSGQTEEARELGPARFGGAGRFWRLKAALVSLLMVAGLVGFLLAAIVLGTIVAVLILGVVSIAFVVALMRAALRR